MFSASNSRLLVLWCRMLSWLLIGTLLCKTCQGASISVPDEVFNTDKEAEQRILDLAAMENERIEKEVNNDKDEPREISFSLTGGKPNESDSSPEYPKFSSLEKENSDNNAESTPLVQNPSVMSETLRPELIEEKRAETEMIAQPTQENEVTADSMDNIEQQSKNAMNNRSSEDTEYLANIAQEEENNSPQHLIHRINLPDLNQGTETTQSENTPMPMKFNENSIPQTNYNDIDQLTSNNSYDVQRDAPIGSNIFPPMFPQMQPIMNDPQSNIYPTEEDESLKKSMDHFYDSENNIQMDGEKTSLAPSSNESKLPSVENNLPSVENNLPSVESNLPSVESNSGTSENIQLNDKIPMEGNETPLVNEFSLSELNELPQESQQKEMTYLESLKEVNNEDDSSNFTQSSNPGEDSLIKQREQEINDVNNFGNENRSDIPYLSTKGESDNQGKQLFTLPQNYDERESSIDKSDKFQLPQLSTTDDVHDETTPNVDIQNFNVLDDDQMPMYSENFNNIQSINDTNEVTVKPTNEKDLSSIEERQKYSESLIKSTTESSLPGQTPIDRTNEVEGEEIMVANIQHNDNDTNLNAELESTTKKNVADSVNEPFEISELNEYMSKEQNLQTQTLKNNSLENINPQLEAQNLVNRAIFGIEPINPEPNSGNSSNSQDKNMETDNNNHIFATLSEDKEPPVKLGMTEQKHIIQGNGQSEENLEKNLVEDLNGNQMEELKSGLTSETTEEPYQTKTTNISDNLSEGTTEFYQMKNESKSESAEEIAPTTMKQMIELYSPEGQNPGQEEFKGDDNENSKENYEANTENKTDQDTKAISELNNTTYAGTDFETHTTSEVLSTPERLEHQDGLQINSSQGTSDSPNSKIEFINAPNISENDQRNNNSFYFDKPEQNSGNSEGSDIHSNQNEFSIRENMPIFSNTQSPQKYIIDFNNFETDEEKMNLVSKDKHSEELESYNEVNTRFNNSEENTYNIHFKNMEHSSIKPPVTDSHNEKLIISEYTTKHEQNNYENEKEESDNDRTTSDGMENVGGNEENSRAKADLSSEMTPLDRSTTNDEDKFILSEITTDKLKEAPENERNIFEVATTEDQNTFSDTEKYQLIERDNGTKNVNSFRKIDTVSSEQLKSKDFKDKFEPDENIINNSKQNEKNEEANEYSTNGENTSDIVPLQESILENKFIDRENKSTQQSYSDENAESTENKINIDQVSFNKDRLTATENTTGQVNNKSENEEAEDGSGSSEITSDLPEAQKLISEMSKNKLRPNENIIQQSDEDLENIDKNDSTTIKITGNGNSKESSELIDENLGIHIKEDKLTYNKNDTIIEGETDKKENSFIGDLVNEVSSFFGW